MSGSNSPPSPGGSAPYKIVETNYVICHTPNDVPPRPRPAPPAPAPLPIQAVTPAAPPLVLARKSAPRVYQSVPVAKYNPAQYHSTPRPVTVVPQQRPAQQYTASPVQLQQRPIQYTAVPIVQQRPVQQYTAVPIVQHRPIQQSMPVLTATQQRPVQQYNRPRPRILARSAPRSVALGLPSAPDSPASPAQSVLPMSDGMEVLAEGYDPSASSARIVDRSANGMGFGSQGMENVYTSQSEGEVTQTGATSNVGTGIGDGEEVILCEDGTYLPISQNSEQMQFSIPGLDGMNYYDLLGLPRPAETTAAEGDGMMLSESADANPAVTYTLGIDASQATAVSMSDANTVQGYEQYLMSAPDADPNQISMGTNLAASQTEDDIEEIYAETMQPVMSFSDFKDYIINTDLPRVEPGTDGNTNVTVSVSVPESQVFVVPPNMADQPALGISSSDGISAQPQPVYILEENATPSGTQLEMPPSEAELQFEPLQAVEEPVPEEASPVAAEEPNEQSGKSPPFLEVMPTFNGAEPKVEPITPSSTEAPRNDLNQESTVPVIDISTEPEVPVIDISFEPEAEIPVLDVSSEPEVSIIDISAEDTRPSPSQSVDVASTSEIVPPATVAKEEKIIDHVSNCDEKDPEAKQRDEHPELSTNAIVGKGEAPQQNGIEPLVGTEKDKETLTNGTDDSHLKLEADEELASSTATEMSPTDSNVDSEAETAAKKSTTDAVDEANSEHKPVENGEVITNGVKETENSKHEATNGTILPPDPSLFSDDSVKLVWEDGVGTFPGTGLKFRVNPTTGVLETCESSITYIQSFKQNLNRFPKHEVPMLSPAKEKNPVLKSGKTKTNPIIGVARTHLKNSKKKLLASNKKKRTRPPSEEKDVSMEETLPEIKMELKEKEESPAPSASGDVMSEGPEVSQEKSNDMELEGGSSPNKSSTESGPVPPAKSKSKLSKKAAKEKEKAPQSAASKEDEDSKLDSESPKLVYAKKSAPIPILPVLPELPVEKSLGVLTVVPILQNSSPLPSPEVEEAQEEEEPEEEEDDASAEAGRQPRKTKGARVPVAPKGKKYKKRRKKVTVEQKLRMKQAANRKRNFEKVLSTRTQHFMNVSKPEDSTTTNATMTESSCASSGNEETVPKSTAQSSSSESGSKTRTASAFMADFSWHKYLSDMNAKAAPAKLFRQPAFPPPNPFKVNMMLEAIDPQHQSLCCVASIVEIQGYRIRIHITGYSESYDFWVNADSYEIFPAGWCEENGHNLEPPPNAETPFNWHKYLVEEQMIAADRNFFAISKEDPVMNSDVAVGMKLEAVDIRNQSLICVATIAQVINDRFLVHFDSWDAVYDYWTDATSPFIHPVGWCEKNGAQLTPPNTYKTEFTWDKYLQETKSVAMPSHLFQPLQPINFKKGMKLECVDKRNSFLIRVATIMEVENHQLTINFDNWPTIYDYKVYECSPDIHPMGWCQHTGHPLQPPPPVSSGTRTWNGPCLTYGCLGLGHVKGPKFLTHNSPANCPYSAANLKKELLDHVPDRVITYEKPINPPEVKRDLSSISPLKTREKRKLEEGEKIGRILHKRKSYVAEGAPAKIKKKSTQRNSDPVYPRISIDDFPSLSEDVKPELTIKTESMQSSFPIDSLPLIKKTKLTCKQLDFSATSSDKLPKLSPAEKDKITIESVPMQVENPTEDSMDSTKSAVSLLRKNLTIKRKSESAISPKPKRAYTPRATKAKGASSVTAPAQETVTGPSPGPSGIVLPKIESTITACPPPGTGPPKTIHSWDETIDSVVRACLRKNCSEDGQSEFILPPSTTMTPIPVPTGYPLSIQTQDMTPKNDNSFLLMVIPTTGATGSTTTSSSSTVANPVPTEATPLERTSLPRSRAASFGSEMRSRRASSQASPFQSPLSAHENDLQDIHPNFALHLRPLQNLIGDLSPATVSKWMTKDVAQFVAKIPGCTTAAKRFTEEMIDGEAFMMMTQADLSIIMGLKMGHCIKLANAIRIIQTN